MQILISMVALCVFRGNKISINERVRRPFTSFLCPQEKYMRDQQKLQEEWHKAQQEISTSVGQQEVTQALSFVQIRG